jgi:hypothetical protein
MAIDVDCECGTRFKVPDSREGRSIACPACRRQFHAPLAVMRVHFTAPPPASNPGCLARSFRVVKLAVLGFASSDQPHSIVGGVGLAGKASTAGSS